MKPNGMNLHLTAENAMALMQMDLAIGTLQLQANQLGGFMKHVEAADVVIGAIEVLVRGREKLVRQWATGIKVVSPGQVIEAAAVNGVPK